MPTIISTLLASHTTPIYTDPLIVRTITGGAIGIGLIITVLWKIATSQASRACSPD